MRKHFPPFDGYEYYDDDSEGNFWQDTFFWLALAYICVLIYLVC